MAHINPGTDTTINPVVIDDSYREKKQHPLRCELCEKLWKVECPYYAWIKTGEVGISCDSYMEFTAIVGCASHTSAPLQTERLCDDRNIIEIENKLADTERQLIMAQQRVDAAIKELERLAAEKDQLKKESKTNEPWMGHAYAASAYMKAIALLQAGRK